ncbi:MAG TPA: hypothetical protein VLQ45_21795 [Thermoanaerobaculia bacterium]|nr:hypothetical protein [Thermoanaerobaculia bacterium]
MSPHRRTGWLLALALLAPGGRSLAAEAPLARLLSPAPGQELTAGTEAVVEWEGLNLPPHAHEWEAFLSVDGGKTWPLRITPHLDLSIRRFTFRVPDLPTREARLMLRFGDEQREVGMEAPQRFAIRPGQVGGMLPPRRSFSRGERPREGDRGVAFWVEGSRQGGRLREVAAFDPPDSFSEVRRARLPWLPLLWPATDRHVLPPPAVAEVDRKAGLAAGARDPSSSLPAPVDVRLLTHRWNE